MQPQPLAATQMMGSEQQTQTKTPKIGINVHNNMMNEFLNQQTLTYNSA